MTDEETEQIVRKMDRENAAAKAKAMAYLATGGMIRVINNWLCGSHCLWLDGKIVTEVPNAVVSSLRNDGLITSDEPDAYIAEWRASVQGKRIP